MIDLPHFDGVTVNLCSCNRMNSGIGGRDPLLLEAFPKLPWRENLAIRESLQFKKIVIARHQAISAACR